MRVLAVLVLGLCIASVSMAVVVEVDEIQIIQNIAVAADYDASTGITTWSQGASGWVYTAGGQYESFSDVDVSATFSGAVDQSSGGLASAVFTNPGIWSISMNHGGGNAVTISGITSTNWTETETGETTDKIDGRAVVEVTAYSFDTGWFEVQWGIGDLDLQWEGGLNSLSGLIADITLPNGTGYTSYDDDYSTTNATITLYADEGVVPEPATICLFGLGTLGLLRKRRA